MKHLHPLAANTLKSKEPFQSNGAMVVVTTSQPCELWFDYVGVAALVDVVHGKTEVRVPTGCSAYLVGKGEMFIFEHRPAIDLEAQDIVSYTAQDTRPLVPAAVQELRRSLRKAEMESEQRIARKLEQAEDRLKAMNKRYHEGAEGGLDAVRKAKADAKADDQADPKPDNQADKGEADAAK